MTDLVSNVSVIVHDRRIDLDWCGDPAAPFLVLRLGGLSGLSVILPGRGVEALTYVEALRRVVEALDPTPALTAGDPVAVEAVESKL